MPTDPADWRPISNSLRAKVTLGIVVPLVVILGLFTAIEHKRHEAVIFNNLTFLAFNTGQVIKNSLRETMLVQDPQGLQHILDSIGQDSALRVVYLLDTDGRVVFAPGGRGVGLRLDNHDPTCQACHRLPPDQRPSSVVVTLPDGERVFRAMNPVENAPECQKCHDPSQRLNGVLLTDISMAPLEANLAADLRENLYWWAGTILVTVVVANLVMSRLLIQRLSRVARMLARFGHGQLGERLPTAPLDEIGRLAEAFNTMAGRLQSEAAENRALNHDLQREAAQRRALLKRLITAQEDERRRVARDLHDDLGQDLAGLALGLEALEGMDGAQAEQAHGHIRQLRAHIAGTTNRVYDMILTLRPSVLDDLGLAPAVRSLADRTLAGAGIAVEVDSSGLVRRLPPELETALFRIIQEGLNNVARHAHARTVRIRLAECGDAFEGEIADDGCGFDKASVRPNGHGPRGLGLLGMQERVAQFCGQLTIESKPGQGTRLRVWIPLGEVSCA